MSEPSNLTEAGPATPSSNRRVAARYPTGSETFSYLTAVMEGSSWPAYIRNISASGISLILDHRVEPETIVNLDLVNRSLMFSCRMPVRVVYVLEDPCGDWILGGSFTRKLNEDELQALL